jgi:hypothetical protein
MRLRKSSPFLYLCARRLIKGTSLVFVYIMPIGLENIGWKMYMINGSWDIVILILIVRVISILAF